MRPYGLDNVVHDQRNLGLAGIGQLDETSDVGVPMRGRGLANIVGGVERGGWSAMYFSIKICWSGATMLRHVRSLPFSYHPQQEMTRRGEKETHGRP